MLNPAWIQCFLFDCRSPHGERGLKLIRAGTDHHLQRSRSPHGERGLKYSRFQLCNSRACRSPHGERGLKSSPDVFQYNPFSRSPHGERGLKSVSGQPHCSHHGRSPHGERGLKSEEPGAIYGNRESLPAWGAWIEMKHPPYFQLPDIVAPRMGSVD